MVKYGANQLENKVLGSLTLTYIISQPYNCSLQAVIATQLIIFSTSAAVLQCSKCHLNGGLRTKLRVGSTCQSETAACMHGQVAFTNYVDKTRYLDKCVLEMSTVHCCIKCPQNLQVKTLLQTYTAFTCRIYNEILLKVLDLRNRGNLLLKLQFFVLQLDFFL